MVACLGPLPDPARDRSSGFASVGDLSRAGFERESKRETIGEIRGIGLFVVVVPGCWALSPTAMRQLTMG